MTPRKKGSRKPPPLRAGRREGGGRFCSSARAPPRGAVARAAQGRRAAWWGAPAAAAPKPDAQGPGLRRGVRGRDGDGRHGLRRGRAAAAVTATERRAERAPRHVGAAACGRMQAAGGGMDCEPL
jgi:hypothetical protein